MAWSPIQLQILLAVIFASSVIQGGIPTPTLTTEPAFTPDFKLPGKETNDVIKKVMESRFMEAVARIDDAIKFLYQINTRLNTLSARLANSADDVTKIEPIVEQFVEACQSDISQYLEHHGEILRKHPLETLTDSVVDALLLRRFGHVDASFLRDAILNRLGQRFATLFQIAQENVATLESGIRTHSADVTRILSQHALTLNSKSSAQYQRVLALIRDLIQHPPN